MPSERKMWVVSGLVAVLLAFELIASMLSHSVALLSDAAHVGTDLLAAIITLYAQRIAHKPSTKAMSFGYSRGTVVAAFVNGVSLILLSLIVSFETLLRFFHPVSINPIWMLAAALISFFVNATIVTTLYVGGTNLNIRSALVHFAGDAIVSLGVILSAVGIWLTHLDWLDPAISLLLVAIMMYTSWRIVREALLILMEGTPRLIDVDVVADHIRIMAGVVAVHDVHIWGVSDTEFAASLHVVVSADTRVAQTDLMLDEIEKILLAKFYIVHTSVQFECGENPLHQGFPHVRMGWHS